MTLVDTIGIQYDTVEELLERKIILEKKIIDYINESPDIANRYETQIAIGDNRNILKFTLFKD